MDAHTAAQKAKVRIWPMRRIKRPLIKMPQANPTKKPDMMTPIRAVEKPCSLAVTASSVFNKPLPSCNSATLARIAPIGLIKVQIHTSLP